MATSESQLKLKKLKLLILDVDGILTDGQTWQDYQGVWRRYFSVRDSMGLRALKKAGVRVAIVTGANSEDLREHAAFIGIEDLVEGCRDKAPVLESLMAKHGVTSNEVALMTEDPRDLELMKGLAGGFTVPTANESMRRAATVVTSRSGGDGAVLEICSLILQHLGASRFNRPARMASV